MADPAFLRRTVTACDTQKPLFYRKRGEWHVLVPMPPGRGVVRYHRNLLAGSIREVSERLA